MAFRSGITRSFSHIVRACKRSPQVVYGTSRRLCASSSSLDEPGLDFNTLLKLILSHRQTVINIENSYLEREMLAETSLTRRNGFLLKKNGLFVQYRLCHITKIC